MDDPALVAAMLRQDPDGLAGAYRRYADRLFAYSYGMVHDRETAADIVQDTFLLAGQHAGQLRDPARLRPWLYAIARSEALRHLRRRARTAPLEAAGVLVGEQDDPAAAVHSAQVAELVGAALSGLSDADREVAELTIRHGLSAPEIAPVLGLSVNHAHARLSRARTQLAGALGALLVARHGQADCAALAELVKGWDGRLTPLLRKRINRHIESCDVCAGIRRHRLNPNALLAGYAGLPFLAVLATQRPAPAPALPRSEPMRWDKDGFPVATRSGRTATVLAAAGAAVLVLLLCGAVAVLQPFSAAQTAPTSSPVPMGTGSTEPGLVNPTGSTSSTTPPSGTTSTGPPPAAPLSVDANGIARCSGGNDFVLAVEVRTDAALSKADLTWKVIGSRVEPMSVSGRTATVLAEIRTAVSTISWWVDLVAADGRTYRSPTVTVSHPCHD